MFDARGIGGFGRPGQRPECQSAEKLDYRVEEVDAAGVIVGESWLRAGGAGTGTIAGIGNRHRSPAR